VNAPSEEKSDDSNYSFYEKLEQVSVIFLSTLLNPFGDFNVKFRREGIFKSKIRHESLHQDSDDNGVRIVNFHVSNNLIA